MLFFKLVHNERVIDTKLKHTAYWNWNIWRDVITVSKFIFMFLFLCPPLQIPVIKKWLDTWYSEIVCIRDRSYSLVALPRAPLPPGKSNPPRTGSGDIKTQSLSLNMPYANLDSPTCLVHVVRICVESPDGLAWIPV